MAGHTRVGGAGDEDSDEDGNERCFQDPLLQLQYEKEFIVV